MDNAMACEVLVTLKSLAPALLCSLQTFLSPLMY